MNALIEARDVSRQFSVRAGMFQPRRTLHAVNQVDLRVPRGSVLGIVGESGCGKSTLARLLLGLIPTSQGTVSIEGQDIRELSRRALARRVQPVFQDPYSSLNPRRSIASIVSLPLEVHGEANPRQHKAIEMLERVGLPPRLAHNTPGQLSGGQRQRVAIARALVTHPEIVICDEPTSALDVSVQAQIMNLLLALRQEFNLTYVFISHNLAVVEHIATDVAVMYLGRVVECAPAAELFHAPRHPYTQALLASVLTPEPGLGIPDTGLGLSFPDPINPPPGCPFHPRCKHAMPQCQRERPVLQPQGQAQVACHLYPATSGDGAPPQTDRAEPLHQMPPEGSLSP